MSKICPECGHKVKEHNIGGCWHNKNAESDTKWPEFCRCRLTRPQVKAIAKRQATTTQTEIKIIFSRQLGDALTEKVNDALSGVLELVEDDWAMFIRHVNFDENGEEVHDATPKT